MLCAHAERLSRRDVLFGTCKHARPRIQQHELSFQVVRRLEAQTHVKVAQLETTSMLRTLNAFGQAIMLCDVAARGWPVLHANDALLQQLGEAP
jgi:hypothetical protein